MSFAYLSKGDGPTTTPGVRLRVHSQMLIQIKTEGPPPPQVLRSPPRGHAELLSPASEDTTCHAKSQLTHNN